MFLLKVPNWINFIVKKRLYLLVPLAALTVANYVKDVKIDKLQSKNDDLSNAVQASVSDLIGKAGVIEQTELIFWVKELIPERKEFIIIYISPGYDQFLPPGIRRHDLIGRTGGYIDDEFGKIYQANDFRASKNRKPIIFEEPYRDYGVGPVKQGDFLKGRLKNSGDRILIFGLFVKESD